MTLKRSTLCSAFVCLVLIGSAFAATPATELLYVQQGKNIVTYSVNTTTAVTKKLGTLGTAYNGATKITINRSGSFLYLLGFSPTIEYFTIYSLTTAGVPHTKYRGYAKRGGGTVQIPFEEAVAAAKARHVDVLALDEALASLSKFDPRKGRVVELRYFGGLSVEETAEVMEISPETAKRDWKMPRRGCLAS
jgi:ECF sigma factor